MARSFPPDVIVLDSDGLVHARLGRGKKDPQVQQVKAYRLPPDTFTPSVVTPELANEAALAEVLRRVKLEAGRINKVSVLIPDGWFRMNIFELQSLPDRADEADAMIRWSLKRTMPIEPSTLRISYEVLTRTGGHPRVLVISAAEKTLKAIERVFDAAGIEVVLIEPIGLNIWNAVAVREEATTRDRIFFYIRDGDFTTAVFRGSQPLFIRSRNLNSQRTLQQEIKLSASYLRDTLRTESIEQCYLAGNNVNGELSAEIGAEFGAPVRRIALRDCVEQAPSDAGSFEAELTACTGVFTG
jgi:Tfp pilus assembly PilM family ATPase